MNAFKCDVCGGYFDGTEPFTEIRLESGKKIKARSLVTFCGDTPTANYVSFKLDVCPNCMGKIAELFKELAN
jgi:rubredoxin